MSDAYFSHQPILGKNGKLTANRLIVHANDAAAALNTLRSVEEFWPMNQAVSFFLSLGQARLEPCFFDWLLPENVILEIRGGDLAGTPGVATAQALRDNATPLCIDVDPEVGNANGANLSFRFFALDGSQIAVPQMQALAVKLRQLGTPIALNIATPKDFKACLDAGLTAASGWFCKEPSSTMAKTLAPAQAQIVRVLNLVRNNADVPQIETALKQDVALSYKLLRYINSAGFGLSCEIQSFRHAVTILGYDKLNKWLSLLLVTASKDPLAPAQMHAALVRARLMEQLGQGLVDKGELDNLFITGAFSLLDVLLGVTMDKALDAMSLPEPILDALLQRSGSYAPFLELALALEEGSAEAIRSRAQSLGLTTAKVNGALLQAIDFAATMAA
jgi:EAL and modified HD-GYP domain-containing signal transduction protein